MKNVKQKIVACVMTAFLFFSLIAPAYAEVSPNGVTQTIATQLEQMLPQFACSESITLDRVTLGKPFVVYRTTAVGVETIDYSIYPVLSNQSIVALANVVGDSAGSVETTLYVDFANALQQYLSANATAEFAIIYAQEGIYLLDNADSLILLKDGPTLNPYPIANISIASCNIIYGDVSPLAQLEIGPTPRVHLSVTRVSNQTASCCGGLCWAASIAMIKNYYDNTSYTAMNIHDTYGCIGIQSATRQIDGVILALNDLGMIGHTLSYDYLTYPILYNYISNDQLLYTRLANTDGGTGHAVVGYGYQYNTSTAYFQFMDPNTGHQSKAFPLNTGSLTFQLSGYNYEVDYYLAVEW